MPAFLRKDRLNGKEIADEVSLADFNAAKNMVSELFDKHDHAFAFEERRFENGVRAVAIRDKSHKILYQLKTIL